jgi:ABC-type nickel/cobalt efflux system permease component RcnA
VILVALLMYGIYGNTPPADAQGWLMMIGGLLIVLVGFWLFMQRLKGQADHVHLFSHHHHDDPAKAKTQFGWLRVILMGLGGGIIPCWDAVLLFLLAMAQGRVGLAIPLLIAFSVGLALVLILLGIGVVLAHRAGGKYFRERRWFKALPILSAVILLAFGVWFLREGYQMVSRGVG